MSKITVEDFVTDAALTERAEAGREVAKALDNGTPISSLNSRVKGTVKFVRFEDSELWYVCKDGFEFPVPLADTAGAKFQAEDKGLYFMRWISKHMKMLELARGATLPRASYERGEGAID